MRALCGAGPTRCYASNRQDGPVTFCVRNCVTHQWPATHKVPLKCGEQQQLQCHILRKVVTRRGGGGQHRVAAGAGAILLQHDVSALGCKHVVSGVCVCASPKCVCARVCVTPKAI